MKRYGERERGEGGKREEREGEGEGARYHAREIRDTDVRDGLPLTFLPIFHIFVQKI
jgi:hypothetical protein